MTEKLQKVLARTGLGSRRQMEKWIEDERIHVNNKLATLGDRVALTDRIKVDGKLIEMPELITTPRVIIYHKPINQICTRHDPEGRDTIFNHLPHIDSGRWISIGRLDINTSGLLLLTDDGELANKLMHPSSQIHREYAVRILGNVTEAILKRLTRGVMLEDGKARFEEIVDSGGKGANHWFHVLVKEGRNRLVRRLWESQGLTVSRLMRVRFGPVFLDNSCRPGKYLELSEGMIKQLQNQVKSP